MISIKPPAQKIPPCVPCVSASGPSVLTQKNLGKCRRHVEKKILLPSFPQNVLWIFLTELPWKNIQHIQHAESCHAGPGIALPQVSQLNRCLCCCWSLNGPFLLKISPQMHRFGESFGTLDLHSGSMVG